MHIQLQITTLNAVNTIRFPQFVAIEMKNI